MNWRTRAAIAATALVGVPAILATGGSAASAGTVSYHFPAPPIASAGSIPPGQTVTFNLRVLIGTAPDPGGVAYIGYSQGGHVPGDSTTVPASQCHGVSVLPPPGTVVPCSADANGVVALTYRVPAQPPAQGRADWFAAASPGASTHAVTHYVYTTVFRYSPSPIAPSGSLAPGQTVSVTLTAKEGLDRGIAGSTVYLSLKRGGGGSASVGGTALSATPAPFTADSGGAIHLTYTAPGSLPPNGQDAIVAQDLRTSATEVASDSYAFSSSTPVISVGDATVVEADQDPGIPAKFTVTIAPAQPSPVTVQYVTLCGIGDKGCGEDFLQIFQPVSVTIPAGASTTSFIVRQFGYVGNNAGETYNEGWYVQLLNPPASAVLGRAVGTGMLLPDVENTSTALPYLYAGDVGLVPTRDAGGSPVYFTVTLGAARTATVTVNYATANGTAVAGVDYAATSGIASIPAGKTSAVIPVTILPASPPSSNRTFTLNLSNASGGLTISRPTGTGTILPS